MGYWDTAHKAAELDIRIHRILKKEFPQDDISLGPLVNDYNVGTVYRFVYTGQIALGVKVNSIGLVDICDMHGVDIDEVINATIDNVRQELNTYELILGA